MDNKAGDEFIIDTRRTIIIINQITIFIILEFNSLRINDNSIILIV